MYGKIHQNEKGYNYKECVLILEFDFTKSSLLGIWVVVFFKYNCVGSPLLKDSLFQIIWIYQFEIISTNFKSLMQSQIKTSK